MKFQGFVIKKRASDFVTLVIEKYKVCNFCGDL